MRCDNFCDGNRPPEKFVYQYEAIVFGEFTLVNDDDAQLGNQINILVGTLTKSSVIVVHQRKLARYNRLILVHKFFGRRFQAVEADAASKVSHRSVM